MKNKLLITILIISALVFGCSTDVSKQNKVNESNSCEELPNNKANYNSNESNNPNKTSSPLDGLKYYLEDLSKRPVAVSIDNHPGARWQAGLKEAEIVYEFEVEYPYTRYLCIYLAKEPKLIGPVRSARPYIIYYAMENDGIFVHVGGSQDAFEEISRLKTAEIDGLYSGSMWRYYDTGKIAPHNMYTTLKSIREEGARLGYRTKSEMEEYKFNEQNKKPSDIYNSFNTADTVNIIYNKSNTTKYTYNEAAQLYLRFKDGEKHIDENNNEQITAKNIIIIEAEKQVLDNEGRLYLRTIGEGKGYYMTDGEAVKIDWVKKSESGRTKFYCNGNQLKLNPGNSWIQIVSSLDNISYN